MKSKLPIIITSVVAACIVCIAAVLAVKMNNNSNPSIEPATDNTYTDFQNTPEYSYPVYNDFTPEETETTQPAQSSAIPSAVTTIPMTDIPSTVLQETQGNTEQASTTVTEKITQITTVISQQFSKVFDMPKAPKYIPPDTDINFDKASIASYKYDPNGNYYYTDDKNAWQSNFGFNEGYDSMAPVTMMFYDTVRTKFVYDNKEWLVQIWKGQYGYAFVGGEVGIYTRKVGSGGTHYNCAKKEDWLKMEMCFMWDEYQTGEYRPVFNRPYTDYWWCTGFVVGFDGGTNRHQFRLVTHITFKDAEMADAFCEAFEKNGFKRVSSLTRNDIDCFVQIGADVGFVWQNINQ
ncbi:MAG: DUF4474 domain-containing protein [Clostridia bacterium]|nr:DUF4474 domain-containing protein [Clostridia bacterium]